MTWWDALYQMRVVRSAAVSPRPPSARLIAAGFGSHLIAGVLPFLSAAAIGGLGLMRGTAALYLAGTAALAVALLSRRLRHTVARETAALRGGSGRLLGIGLVAFLGAGVAYYVGLAASGRVAEYIFLTRLDWLAQAVVAIVWLGETWTKRGLTGAALALSGGLLLAWTGAFGPSGVAAALAYIGLSLVGYSCFKPLSASRGTPGAVTLTMWRHVVNTCGFAGLALIEPASNAALTPAGLVAAVAAGLLIVILFLLRFTALTALPLWVLSAQAPTQALIAVAITAAVGGMVPASSLAAIGLVVAGECLVTWPAPANPRAGRDAKDRSAC